MTRIKRLIDRYSFSDWFPISILKYIGLCDRRVTTFEDSNYVVNIFCSVFD